MSNAKANGATHVVIGGSGFLGVNILLALINRGEKNVYNFDLRAPSGDAEKLTKGVTFRSVDITSLDSLNEAFAAVKPDVVYHTASPIAIGKMDEDLMVKVNVLGTENIVSACQRASVKVLVFTSSSSVVADGNSLINVDERLPYPVKFQNFYSETKARAEKLVLEANTDEQTEGLKTVSIRPATIFGPYDRQLIPSSINVVKNGKQNVQIGDNQSLFDFTYVENIAHAQLLAGDKLLAGNKSYSRDLLASVHLPVRSNGILEKDLYLNRDVPTSEQRQDVTGATDFARSLPSTIADVARNESGDSTIDLRPVIRNKFDQFFHIVNPEVASAGNPIPEIVSVAEDSIPIAGQAFFITNGQPVPFWTFMRTLWQEYQPGSVDSKKVWHLSAGTGYALAYISEWVSWLSGREGTFDRYKVSFTTVTRYFNIEKARRALGYEPLYGVEEGIRRSVAWYKDAEKKGQFASGK